MVSILVVIETDRSIQIENIDSFVINGMVYLNDIKMESLRKERLFQNLESSIFPFVYGKVSYI
jgi:hypothetical protein